MQVNISARHGHLSPGTQEKITEKVQKLPRLYDRIAAVEVTCDLEHKESPSVEVRLSVEKAPGFVASDQAETLLAALDSVMHKLEQQLRKHKEKVQEHRATGLKGLEASAPETETP